jgi:hypothetical protein
MGVSVFGMTALLRSKNTKLLQTGANNHGPWIYPLFFTVMD